jgi:anti-anti-sigma factor
MGADADEAGLEEVAEAAAAQLPGQVPSVIASLRAEAARWPGPSGSQRPGQWSEWEAGLGRLRASVSAGEWFTLVRLAAQADMTVSGQLRDVLAEHVSLGAQLVVDLSGLHSIDSTCLRLLVQVCRDLEEVGGTLGLASPQPAVAQMMMLAGTGQLIAVYGSVEEAAESALPPLKP